MHIKFSNFVIASLVSSLCSSEIPICDNSELSAKISKKEKPFLYLDLACLESIPKDLPKRDMDVITYDQNKSNPTVTKVTQLEMQTVISPTFPAILKDAESLKSLKDLNTDDVKSMLLELGLLPHNTSYREFYIEFSPKDKGFYTSAIYTIYATLHSTTLNAAKQNLVYVVKFHNPSKTPIHALWNQVGVKTHSTLRTQDFRITSLPKLAFEEKSAKVKLEDDNYHFSVIHAAKGQLALEIFKEFGKAEQAKRVAQTPKILEILTQIGEALGSFHSYHALKNPDLRNDCIRYILQIGNINSFLTITHSDLHPGNVFITSKNNAKSGVTFIDLESMFMSAISPNGNMIDVVHFFDKTVQILQIDLDKGAVFLKHFQKAYKVGLKSTLQQFLRLNLLKKIDFVKALHFPSSPISKLDLTLQDSFETPIDQAFD